MAQSISQDKLGFVQFAVFSAGSDQLGMGSGFDNFALVDDKYSIGISDRRQSMCDDEGRPITQHAIDRPLKKTFGLRVDAGRRFVEDEYSGIVENRPCKGDELPLTDRESGSSLEYLGLETVRSLFDKLEGVDRFSSGTHLILGRLEFPVAYIVIDRPGEKKRILHHYTDLSTQSLE